MHSIHQFSGVLENHLHIRGDLYSSILAYFNTVNSPLPSASCNRHEKASAHNKKKIGRHGITYVNHDGKGFPLSKEIIGWELLKRNAWTRWIPSIVLVCLRTVCIVNFPLNEKWVNGPIAKKKWTTETLLHNRLIVMTWLLYCWQIFLRNPQGSWICKLYHSFLYESSCVDRRYKSSANGELIASLTTIRCAWQRPVLNSQLSHRASCPQHGL